MVLTIPVTVVVVKAPFPNGDIKGIPFVDLLSYVFVFSIGTEVHPFRNDPFLRALPLCVQNGH